MNWSDLLYALKSIPENRLEEPAVVCIDGSEIHLIDNIDIIESNDITWDDLADNSIYPDEEITHNLPPINLTP